MTTRRWDPLRDLLTLQERMNRLFEDTLSATRTAPPLGTGNWIPLADVYETADGFVVQVDLPGLGSDDVEVHVDGDRLVLRGRRKETARPDNYYRMERSYGPFVRTFVLTPDVDPDRVTAQFRDGLLRLELPKVRPGVGWRARGDEEAR